MDLKDIKAIIDLMRKNSISEFELEKEGFKVRLKRGLQGGGSGAALEDAPQPAGVPMIQAAPAPAAPALMAPAPRARATPRSNRR